MWYSVMFLFMYVQYGEGSLMDRMTETRQLCCLQGTTYARNHSLENCSFSVPSNVPPGFESVCILAMKQCCVDYFLMKNLCEIGIEVAMTLNTCSSLSIDTAKMCCSKCSIGRSLRHNWNGNRTCEMNNNGRNAQELLASDALVKCCKNASTILKMNAHIETVKNNNEYNVCEDYEPNELCEHHCIPIHGSYKCECNPGFILMADSRNCKEITKNRCNPSNPCQHKCFDNGVEVKCSCPRGYRLMAVAKTCKDNNECVLDKTICLPITHCVNISESHKCTFNKKIQNQDEGPCPSGFVRNSSSNACDDIDECIEGTHLCDHNQNCLNTNGSHECHCISGFELDPTTGVCVDTGKVDEKRWTEIKPTACEVGFAVDQFGVCFDIDECETNQHTCSNLTEICKNAMGGYLCDCAIGFRRDILTSSCILITISSSTASTTSTTPVTSTTFTSSTTPEPTTSTTTKRITSTSTSSPTTSSITNSIGECATGQAQCGPLQVCTNHDKGYSCSCLPGYRLNDDSQCQDIDECAISANMSICLEHSECINTVGSYMCRCHNGLRSASVNEKVCVDVDECVESRSGSLCQQHCNNVWGSYKCSCHRGYRLNPDNRTCSDVDECTELKKHNLCVGKCLNEPGSYRCICPSGYSLSEDNRSCIDIDECETGIATCARDQSEGTRDICLNTHGGYLCHRITCPHGYQLENEKRCIKIQTSCPPSDSECAHQPTTYSYNFMTFVSNLYIPESKINLFTMRGPPWAYAKMSFLLRIVKVDAPPSVKVKADINSFLLIQTANQAVITLVKPLEGPQNIELDLSMELFSRGQFRSITVAKLNIYVSEYEF